MWWWGGRSCRIGRPCLRVLDDKLEVALLDADISVAEKTVERLGQELEDRTAQTPRGTRASEHASRGAVQAGDVQAVTAGRHMALPKARPTSGLLLSRNSL
jgi:hypothetical protein